MSAPVRARAGGGNAMGACPKGKLELHKKFSKVLSFSRIPFLYSNCLAVLGLTLNLLSESRSKTFCFE